MENHDIFEELPIGSRIMLVEDVELEIRQGNSCSGCYFNFCMGRCKHFVCSSTERKDKLDIIFVKL